MQIIPLSEPDCFDYVAVTGEDARKFLQGQITCNMDLLAADRSLHGALCNLKGRVIADFQVFQLSESRIILQTAPGIGQKIIDTLSRYAVFSKTELELVNGPVAVFGIIGSISATGFQQLLPGFPTDEHAVVCSADFLIMRMPGSEARYQLWCRTDSALAAVRSLPLADAQTPSSAWLLADIQAGIVHVNPDSSESYTPQLLNYDISGVVDFDKGCYTGQEVVARMHYRATAKKRLYRLLSSVVLDKDSIISPAGQSGQTVAEILSVAVQQSSHEGSEALAILSTELAASKPALQVAGVQQSRVQLAPLPYLAD